MEENKKEENITEEIRLESDQTGKTEDGKDQTDSSQEVMSGESRDNNPMAAENKIGADQVADDETKDETATDKIPNDGSEADKEIDKEPEAPAKRRKKWVIPLVVSLACVLVLLGVAYKGMDIYYQSHFLPNTEINGIDCSGMTALEAAALLDEQIQEYSLEITGRNYSTGESGTVLGTISPQDIQLSFVDMLGAAEEVMAKQEWLPWVKAFGNLHSGYSLVQNVVFDDAMLESTVEAWEACQSHNMVKARDAYIGEFSEELQGYEIVPETSGTELDVKQVIDLVADAVFMQETSLDLEAFNLYNEASVRQDDNSLTTPVETANRWLGTNITYDWNGNEVILDVSTIRDWVTIEDGEAILDEDAVKDFVKAQSKSYDTYGKKKKFVTTLGVEMNLNSPSYGWRTDTAAETEELIQLIQEGSTDSREPIYTHKGMIKGTSDIGNSYVEADLTNQHLYLYQDGNVVLETDFVSGKMTSSNTKTPEGIFGITYKTRNAVLRGADYATPVSYWMPFYGNYGMHDANWRGSFGGDIYVLSGSHGCINLPPSMAEQIYGYVSTGFPVVCYYYSEPVVPPVPVEGEAEIVEATIEG